MAETMNTARSMGDCCRESESLLKIVVYTSDPWETACPILRFRGPAAEVSFPVIKGGFPGAHGLEVRLEAIAEAEIVLIQREFPRHLSHYEQVIDQARRYERPVVYELDDLLTEVPPEHIDWEYYRTARLPILRAILEADAVTVSTPGLYHYLRSYNAQVWLLPNYLNDRLWTFQSEPQFREHAPVVIGYMGGHTHGPDLAMIEATLLRVLERWKGRVILKFFGKASPPRQLVGRDDVSHERLYLPDYAQFARHFSKQACDIFIAPLQDNLFNRCKSAIKFLEYSAVGVPGVYSRIASYESVVDGHNGLLAATPDEWEHALTQLIEDPTLRIQMGREARRTVQEGWLLSDHAFDWGQAYRSILNAGKVTLGKEFAVHAVCRTQIWLDETEALMRGATQTHLSEQLCPHRNDLVTQIRNAIAWYSVAPISRIFARFRMLLRELVRRTRRTG